MPPGIYCIRCLSEIICNFHLQVPSILSILLGSHTRSTKITQSKGLAENKHTTE